METDWQTQFKALEAQYADVPIRDFLLAWQIAKLDIVYNMLLRLHHPVETAQSQEEHQQMLAMSMKCMGFYLEMLRPSPPPHG